MHHMLRGARWKSLFWVAAGMLATSPMSVWALGVGKLTVLSGLDEPLNGQIELISPTAQELKTLKASLASRADFDIAGVERAAHLFDIKYALTQGVGGRHYLKVTTDNPIREPFLHFLVQVEWSGGKLIREYSALLDPPHWASGTQAVINPPEAAPGETVITPSRTPAAPVAGETSAPMPVVEPSATAQTQEPLEELPPLGTGLEQAEAVQAEKTQLAGAETAAPSPPAAAEPIAPVTAEPPMPSTSEAASPVPAEPAVTAADTSLTPPVSEVASSEPAAPMSATTPIQEYGPVQKGETLSHIAAKVNSDKTLSPQQVMIALMRANPSAFFGNNVNNLKAGKILKVPERDSIAGMPRDQAAREYRAQYDAWQEYKLKLAGTSRMVAVNEPEKPAEEPAKAAIKSEKTDKAEKPSKQKPASGKAEPVDLLKIVRANLEQEVADETTKTPGVETKKDAAKEQGKLNERVATLEEAIESKQMQNKEMRDRVGKLQEQVKNTERLIELENKDVALAQKQAAEKQAAEAAAKAAEEKAAAEKAAAEKAAAEKAAAEAASKAATAKTETTKPVPSTAKKPAPKSVAAPAPTAEEGFLDSLLASVMDNTLALALLGGVGALAAGMGGLYAYRRRRASREFSESILSGSSLSSDVSITDTSGQAAPSDTSFLSDFSQGGMGNIHTDEVDPIAEAEVYLAYGRDEQAEEILKDAIVKDPIRQELKGKLLEIYFQRNDVSAFETLAEELYAQLEGKGGKVWEKTEEMGRKLSPNNPMFRGGKPTAASAAATTLLDTGSENLGIPRTDTALQFEAQDTQAATSGTDTGGIDFNLNFESEAPAPSAPSGLDFSFDTESATSQSAESGAAAGDLGMDFSVSEPSSSHDTTSLMDFSLDNAEDTSSSSSGIDFTASGADSDSGSIEFNASETSGLSFESDSETGESENAELAEATLPGWDETATKLDLAKAYIDMGDSEGARSILEEVIAEGNDQQKKQARELSSQIAA
jgi:pilus assembly protein FimV